MIPIKRVLQRSFVYIRRGQSIGMFPLSIFNAITTIYYLAINNIPPLKVIFPHFSNFLLLVGAPLLFGFTFLGYASMKGRLRWLYEQEQEVPADANPFAYKYRPGRESLIYKYNPIIERIRLNEWLFLSKMAQDRGEPPLLTEEEADELRVYISYLEHLGKGGDLRKMKK